MFDREKIITDPSLLEEGKSYIMLLKDGMQFLMPKGMELLRKTVEEGAKRIPSVNVRIIGGVPHTDSEGSLSWAVWYPMDGHVEGYAPYDEVSLEWVGKTLLSMDGDKAFLICHANSALGKVYLTFDAKDEGIGLQELLDGYTWADHARCGIPTGSEKEGV